MSPGQPKVTNLMLTDESLMEMGGGDIGASYHNCEIVKHIFPLGVSFKVSSLFCLLLVVLTLKKRKMSSVSDTLT